MYIHIYICMSGPYKGEYLILLVIEGGEESGEAQEEAREEQGREGERSLWDFPVAGYPYIATSFMLGVYTRLPIHRSTPI